MTRIGRFVAGVGAVVIGLATVAAMFLLRRYVVPESSAVLAWLWLLATLVVFGVTVGACYTWAVDGPFVRSRHDA